MHAVIGDYLETTVPYCRLKWMLQELVPSPRCSRSSPLQADQSSVVCLGQTVLLLPLRLICHWPDLKLLDLCLRTFKTLWQEVIHWIRKPVGEISWCRAKASIKLHVCGSSAPSIACPVSLDPACHVKLQFISRENTFKYQGWVQCIVDLSNMVMILRFRQVFSFFFP